MTYDATIGRKLPNLPRIHIAYERGDIYPIGDADRLNPWDVDRAIATLEPAGTSPIMIDDESRLLDGMWNDLPETQLEANRDHLAHVIDIAKQAKPNNIITAYNVAQPRYSLDNLDHQATAAETEAAKAARDRGSDGRIGHHGLVDRLHLLTAVLYARASYTATLDGWIARSDRTIRFQRRYHKPIVGLLMPYYHAHHRNPDLAGQLIPLADWRGMIEWTRINCAHVGIWHYPASFGKPFPDEYLAAAIEGNT